ncbi:hypothetical protein, partial [Bilophila wadsworthia]|uniref:hypothetical protein n=1 Tax=Bilophila wadsworthia TaxID=35833 RepID=UPI00242F512F
MLSVLERGASALLENVQVHHHHHHLLLLLLLLLLLRRKREPTHSIRRESRHEGFDKEEKFRGKRGGGKGTFLNVPIPPRSEEH